MKPLHLALLIIMNVFWAGSYSSFKVLGAHLSSGSIATLRFALAAVVLAVLWPWLPGRAPRGVALVRALWMGIIVFTCGPRLQVEAVLRGQAGDTSLLMALEPLIASLAAAVFLREYIAPRRWIGCAFGMLGVVLLSQIWRSDVQPLRGLIPNLLFISSFVCETAFSVIGKPLLEKAGAVKLLAVSLMAGTMVNLSWDWIAGAQTFAAATALPISAWVLLGYLGLVCTILGYTLWYVVIRETQIHVAVLTVFVQPVVGVLLSIIWVGESLHWGQLWGSLVIVAGLFIGLRSYPRSRSQARTEVAENYL